MAKVKKGYRCRMKKIDFNLLAPDLAASGRFSPVIRQSAWKGWQSDPPKGNAIP
jgi:hypothetical protein